MVKSGRGGVNTIIVFGNPPFGKNASLALKFVNKSAGFANWIGFILPLSFDKPSVFNRVDRHLHLVFSEILEQNSFIFEGKERHVPCKFYISEKRSELRELIPVGKAFSNLVSFVKPELAMCLVQRVGANAGRIWFNSDRIKEKASSKNFYFVKIATELLSEEQLILMNTMTFEDCVEKGNTSGMPSISKPELVQLIHEYLGVEIE